MQAKLVIVRSSPMPLSVMYLASTFANGSSARWEPLRVEGNEVLKTILALVKSLAAEHKNKEGVVVLIEGAVAGEHARTT